MQTAEPYVSTEVLCTEYVLYVQYVYTVVLFIHTVPTTRRDRSRASVADDTADGGSVLVAPSGIPPLLAAEVRNGQCRAHTRSPWPYGPAVRTSSSFGRERALHRSKQEKRALSVALTVPPLDHLHPAGKPISTLPDETSVALGDSAEELYKRLAAQTALSTHRLRVTKGSDGSLVPNSKDVTLDSTGLRDRSSIYLKDLGEDEEALAHLRARARARPLEFHREGKSERKKEGFCCG